jgi:hypothetical protein
MIHLRHNRHKIHYKGSIQDKLLKYITIMATIIRIEEYMDICTIIVMMAVMAMEAAMGPW